MTSRTRNKSLHKVLDRYEEDPVNKQIQLKIEHTIVHLNKHEQVSAIAEVTGC